MDEPPPISVEFPWWFIRPKRINHRLEIRAVLGLPLELTSGGFRFELRPATMGFLVLLESIDSPFFLKPAEASALDICRAAACANGGEELLKGGLPAIDAAAEKLARPFRMGGKESPASVIIDHYGEVVEWLLSIPWYGYEMLRNQGKHRAQEEFLFCGPSLAAIIDTGTKYANLSARDAIWTMPLALAGHLIEVNDCGTLHPERPKDAEDLRIKTAEYIDREMRGEPHPWQVKEPELYPLSPRQRYEQFKRKMEDLAHGNA